MLLIYNHYVPMLVLYLGQNFFFVLPTLPTQFFENWKKNKTDFFPIYFFIIYQVMKYYRVIALISANMVPSLDIEGRELAK